MRFIHESSVFCPEKFRKFYRNLFCNRLHPQLWNSSIKFIQLFFLGMSCYEKIGKRQAKKNTIRVGNLEHERGLRMHLHVRVRAETVEVTQQVKVINKPVC